MKQFRVPIMLPDTQRVLITQPYGPTSNQLEPEGPNGETHFHYGIDLVCGDDHHTYGVGLVCPFPTMTVTEKTWAGAMNKTGNGIVADYTDESGVKHTAVLWHCSELQEPTAYTEGELVARIGNAGLVFPSPTLRDPYAGAHLHLGYKRNGVWTDPLTAFDITRPYPGPAPDLSAEMPPAEWVVRKILALLSPFINHAPSPVPSNQPTP